MFKTSINCNATKYNHLILESNQQFMFLKQKTSHKKIPHPWKTSFFLYKPNTD